MVAGGIDGLDIKMFDSPDETMEGFERAGAVRVNVGGLNVWRYTFEPGWRFTEHADPDPCPDSYVACVASGRLRIKMQDGTESEAGPGSIVTIGPGHDAWTVGDEDCVIIDFAESVTP
jgi:quercetin dioxygenase-like cupin family protein